MSTADELRRVVKTSYPRLCAIPTEKAAERPVDGGWSQVEVLGHLVDSASNNHQRFVRAQFVDGLIFAGYEQDAWVAAQRYSEASWSDLAELWRTFNLHLAHVIESAPREQLDSRRDEHNLHEIAWKTVPRDIPTTLGYFMNDYVEHVKHHLAQILAER